jgi:urea transport system substrate-binding protein
MTHGSGLRSLIAGIAAVVLGMLLGGAGHPFGNVWAVEPIKVGILHSLSGTMAISETPIKEVVLMAIDEINKAGGVIGRPVEPVIEDPASNWDLFAEKSKKLLQQDKVATVFGCWTSVSRK